MIRSRDSDGMSPNRPARWKLVVLNQRPSWSRLTVGSVRLPPGLPRLDCAGGARAVIPSCMGQPRSLIGVGPMCSDPLLLQLGTNSYTAGALISTAQSCF